jgi:hypothetical protein
VPAPAAAFVSATLLGMTTGQFSYALKSKLPGGLCLIIIGTEGGGADGIGGQPGNCNALKHGRYTAEAIIQRREVTALIRACRDQLSGMRGRKTDRSNHGGAH